MEDDNSNICSYATEMSTVNLRPNYCYQGKSYKYFSTAPH
jgi:hypothetical protein